MMVIDSRNLVMRQEASIVMTAWSSLEHSSSSFLNSRAHPSPRLHVTRTAKTSDISNVLMSRMRDVSGSHVDATTALTTTTERNVLLASATSHLDQEKIVIMTSPLETSGTSRQMTTTITAKAREQRQGGGCSTTTRTATLRHLLASRN